MCVFSWQQNEKKVPFLTGNSISRERYGGDEIMHLRNFLFISCPSCHTPFSKFNSNSANHHAMMKISYSEKWKWKWRGGILRWGCCYENSNTNFDFYGLSFCGSRHLFTHENFFIIWIALALFHNNRIHIFLYIHFTPQENVFVITAKQFYF